MPLMFDGSLGQPEGRRDSSRWSADHRKPSSLIIGTPEGVPENPLKEWWHPFRVQTDLTLLTGGLRSARPPATICQPFGLMHLLFNFEGANTQLR